jgi:hypothetical protein
MKKADLILYKDRLLASRSRLLSDVNHMADSVHEKAFAEAGGSSSFMPINVMLAACALFIVQNHTGFFWVADAVYWAIVGSLLAARYVDIRYLRGTTADGEPATMVHWRRYAVTVILISVCLWLVMHAIAFLRGWAAMHS